MADAIKPLGQQAPGPVLTVLCTPVAASQVVNTVTVCNTSAGVKKFRLSVAIAGAANAIKQYIYYDMPVAPNDTFAATLGITLALTDELRCYGEDNTLAFNAFGLEAA